MFELSFGTGATCVISEPLVKDKCTNQRLMKEKPLPAMVRAYINSGKLAEQMGIKEDQRRRFESARQTLFHFMTPTERAFAMQLEEQMKPKEPENG